MAVSSRVCGGEEPCVDQRIQQLSQPPLKAVKHGRLAGQVRALREALFDLQAAVGQRGRADDGQCAADAVQHLDHAFGLGLGDRLTQAVQVGLHALHEQRRVLSGTCTWRSSGARSGRRGVPPGCDAGVLPS